MGIDARTTLQQVNKEARIVTQWSRPYQPPGHISLTPPPPVYVRLDQQTPLFLGIPFEAGIYHMLKKHFVPGVYCHEELKLDRYHLPILQKTSNIPRIAFSIKSWSALILGDNDVFDAMDVSRRVKTEMGVLAAFQFLGVKEGMQCLSLLIFD